MTVECGTDAEFPSVALGSRDPIHLERGQERQNDNTP
jgi:hypothetical protein